MEKIKGEYILEIVAPGTYTDPVNKELTQSIQCTVPHTFSINVRNQSELSVIITTKNFVHFVDCLLEGLVELEKREVYAGFDSVKTLILDSKKKLTESVTKYRDSTSLIYRLKSHKFAPRICFYPKFYATIILGYVVSEHFDKEDGPNGVELYKIVANIRQLCFQDKGSEAELIIKRADQYLDKFQCFEGTLGISQPMLISKDILDSNLSFNNSSPKSKDGNETNEQKNYENNRQILKQNPFGIKRVPEEPIMDTSDVLITKNFGPDGKKELILKPQNLHKEFTENQTELFGSMEPQPQQWSNLNLDVKQMDPNDFGSIRIKSIQSRNTSGPRSGPTSGPTSRPTSGPTSGTTSNVAVLNTIVENSEGDITLNMPEPNLEVSENVEGQNEHQLLYQSKSKVDHQIVDEKDFETPNFKGGLSKKNSSFSQERPRHNDSSVSHKDPLNSSNVGGDHYDNPFAQESRISEKPNPFDSMNSGVEKKQEKSNTDFFDGPSQHQSVNQNLNPSNADFFHENTREVKQNTSNAEVIKAEVNMSQSDFFKSSTPKEGLNSKAVISNTDFFHDNTSEVKENTSNAEVIKAEVNMSQSDFFKSSTPKEGLNSKAVISNTDFFHDNTSEVKENTSNAEVIKAEVNMSQSDFFKSSTPKEGLNSKAVISNTDFFHDNTSKVTPSISNSDANSGPEKKNPSLSESDFFKDELPHQGIEQNLNQSNSDFFHDKSGTVNQTPPNTHVIKVEEQISQSDFFKEPQGHLHVSNQNINTPNDSKVETGREAFLSTTSNLYITQSSRQKTDEEIREIAILSFEKLLDDINRDKRDFQSVLEIIRMESFPLYIMNIFHSLSVFEVANIVFSQNDDMIQKVFNYVCAIQNEKCHTLYCLRCCPFSEFRFTREQSLCKVVIEIIEASLRSCEEKNQFYSIEAFLDEKMHLHFNTKTFLTEAAGVHFFDKFDVGRLPMNSIVNSAKGLESHSELRAMKTYLLYKMLRIHGVKRFSDEYKRTTGDNFHLNSFIGNFVVIFEQDIKHKEFEDPVDFIYFMSEISELLNKEDQTKLLNTMKQVMYWKISPQEIPLLKTKLMFKPNSPSIIRDAFSKDILSLLRVSSNQRNKDGVFPKILSLISAEFSKDMDQETPFRTEVYRILENEWLGDFSVLVEQLLEGEDQLNYIHSLNFVASTQNKVFEIVVKKVTEFLNNFRTLSLTIHQFEKWGVKEDKLLELVTKCEVFLRNNEYPLVLRQKISPENVSYLNQMKVGFKENKRIMSFLNSLRMDENRLFSRLNKAELENTYRLLEDPTKASFKDLKKCQVSNTSTETIATLTKMKNYNLIPVCLDEQLAKLQTANQEIDLQTYENLIVNVLKDFKKNIAASLGTVNQETYGRLRKTVKEIEVEIERKNCVLVSNGDFTQQECKILIENFGFFELLQDTDNYTTNLSSTYDSLVSERKLIPDSKVTNFINRSKQLFQQYSETRQFSRENYNNVFNQEDRTFVEFVKKNKRFIYAIAISMKLLMHFKFIDPRHFEAMLIDRDSSKFKQLTNEFIEAVRDMTEIFKQKEFADIISFFGQFERVERAVQIVESHPSMATTMIECSKELSKGENESTKIEKILGNSRIMLVYDENRQMYSIYSAFNRPDNERFQETKEYVLSGADTGKHNFTFEQMEDIKIKFGLNESLSPSKSSVSNSNLKNPFVLLMKSLEKILENISELKRKGIILDLDNLLRNQLNIKSRKGEDVDKALSSLSVRGSDIMILLKESRRNISASDFNCYHVQTISDAFAAILLEADTDPFETQPENHWMHYLDGKQKELILEYCFKDQDNMDEIIVPAQEERIHSIVSNIPGVRKLSIEQLKSHVAKVDVGKDLHRCITSLGRLIMANQNPVQKQAIGSSKFKFVGYTENRYKVFFQTLILIKYQGEVHPSQVFFGSTTLNTDAMECFIKRAVYDSEQRWYFFLDIDLLNIKMRNELIRLCRKYLQKSLSRNASLLLFCEKDSNSNIYNELNKHNDFFEEVSCISFLTEEFKKVYQSFIESLPCHTVLSEFSGLGKSYYIRKTVFDTATDLQAFFLSGEVHQEIIEKRITILRKSMSETKTKTCLHIQIDMMDNMIANCQILDQILFRICFLKCYPYKDGWHSFKNIHAFFFEIGNSYKKEILERVSFISLNEKNHIEMKKFDKIMPFSSLDLNALEGPERKLSTVVKCWEGFKNKNIAKMSLREFLENSADLPENKIKDQLKEIFLLKGDKKDRVLEDGNYNQLFALVGVIYRQLMEMDEVSSLNPAFHMLDEKNEHDQEVDRKQHKILMRSLEQTRLTAIKMIFELASELVWSVVSQIRQESILSIEAVKKKGSLNPQSLDNFKKMIEDIPKWELDNKINIIFNSGCMKITYKDAKSIRQDIKNVIITQTNRDLLDYASFKNPIDKEKKLLEELFEAVDLIKYLPSKYLSPDFVESVKTKKNPHSRYIAELFRMKNKFNTKGYTLTIDNYLKILNIVQRAQLNIPIVIMGATGCGKTYMIDFIARFIFREEFVCFTLHSGITETDIENTLERAIELADNKPAERVWLLFDEFNTSPFQCLICEVMTERKCSFSDRIERIPNNLVFVAACNPFRIKVNNTAVGLVHESSTMVLSHRVYPIPQTLIDYIWDFGQLPEDVEVQYIVSMIENDNEITKRAQIKTDINSGTLAACVVECQSFLRKTETDSSVSLRDVQRFIDLYLHFVQLFENEPDAMIMASYVAYFLRIETQKNRDDLEKNLQSKLPIKLPFQKRFRELSNDFIEDVKKLDVIPRHISINQPLIENLLAICVAIRNKMPVIICGKPGTSKTVAVGISYQIFNSSDDKKNETRYFKGAPINIQLNFWGSITTTSARILDTFNRAKEIELKQNEARDGNKADKTRKLVTIVFDEIGLAEIADSNPLKVLHPLLEEKKNIGFVGLSNWKLDLSKMNRVIYVARPDMSSKDLFSTCMIKPGDTDILSKRLEILSEAYSKFRLEESNETNYHPNFFGSRDFYSLIRLIKSQVPNIPRDNLESKNIDLLIHSAIERNFSGKKIDKLRCSTKLRRFYLELLSKDPAFKGQTLKEMSSMDLIYQNLLDDDSRHLMIFCEAIDMEDIVVEEIKKFMIDFRGKDPNKFEFLKKSRGVEDLQSIFSKLPIYVKEGFTLIMKDLDSVYGCLYDLLNQNYTIKDGKKGCSLFYDNNEKWIEVHDEFKCILLMEREDSSATQFEFEKKQQPPFLNRFEKHLVMYSDLIQNDDELVAVQGMYEKLLKNNEGFPYFVPNHMIHNLSKELIFSKGTKLAVLAERRFELTSIGDFYKKLFKSNTYEGSSLTENEVNPDEYKNSVAQINKKMCKLHSRNMILEKFFTLNPENLKLYEKEFHESHPYNDLRSFLQKTNNQAKKSIIFTYSSIWTVKDILENPENQALNVKFIDSFEIYSQGIVERDTIFKDILECNETIILLQFRDKTEWRFIQDFRYKFDQIENTANKSIVFIAHTSLEDVQNQVQLSTSINLRTENWEMITIDNLSGCYYKEFFALMSSTSEELPNQHVKGIENYNQKFFKDVVTESIKNYMVLEANSFNGLAGINFFVDLIEREDELCNYIINKITQEKENKPKKIFEKIKSLPDVKKKCGQYLDCEQLIKGIIRREYEAKVGKIVKRINEEQTLEVLFLSNIISPEFRKDIFVEWMGKLKGDTMLTNFSFINEHKNVNLDSFLLEFQTDIQKGRERICLNDETSAFKAQTAVTMSKGSFKEENAKVVHGMMRKKVVLTSPESERDYPSEERRILFALQVCAKHLSVKRRPEVGETLKILTQMVQCLRKDQTFVKYFSQVKTTIILCIFLLELYSVQLQEMIYRSYDHEFLYLRFKEKVMENFEENLILRAVPEMEELLSLESISTPDELFTRICNYRKFIEGIDMYDRRLLKGSIIVAKFLEEWNRIQEENFPKVRTAFNLRNFKSIEHQNMILEIIQLCSGLSDMSEMKHFIRLNLYQILEALDEPTIDKEGRVKALEAIIRNIFSNDDSSDLRMITFSQYVARNIQNKHSDFNALDQLLRVVQGMWIPPDKMKKFYFDFINSGSLKRCFAQGSSLSQNLRNTIPEVERLLTTVHPFEMTENNEIKEKTNISEHSLLNQNDCETLSRFKWLIRMVRSRSEEVDISFNERRQIDDIVKTLFNKKSKPASDLLFIIVKALFHRWNSQQLLQANHFEFVSQLEFIPKHKTMKFLPGNSKQREIMEQFRKVITQDLKSIGEKEELQFYEKLEYLNMFFFDQIGNGSMNEFLYTGKWSTKSPLMKNLLTKVQETLPIREEMKIPLFIILNGFNLLERPLFSSIFLRDARLLINYNPLLYRYNQLLPWITSNELNKSSLGSSISMCSTCRFPSHQATSSLSMNESSDPRQCQFCSLPSPRETLTPEQFISIQKELTVRNYQEFVFEPLDQDGRQSMNQLYDEETDSPVVARFVHLLQYVIHYGKCIDNEEGLHVPRGTNVLEYVFNHILNDIRILTELIGKDADSIFILFNIGLCSIEKSIAKLKVDTGRNVVDYLRKEAVRAFTEITIQPNNTLGDYEHMRREYLEKEMSKEAKEEAIISDYITDRISDDKLQQYFSQRMRNISLYMKEKKPVTMIDVRRKINEKNDLKSRFLQKLLFCQELFENYPIVMKGLKRFSLYFKKRFEMELKKEDCLKFTMKALIKSKTSDVRSMTEELTDDLSKEFSLLSEILELAIRLAKQYHTLFPFTGDNFKELKEIQSGDALLCQYLVTNENNRSHSPMEILLNGFLNIQNGMLEDFKALSVFQKLSIGEKQITNLSFIKCSDLSFITIPPNLEEFILDRSFFGIKENDDGDLFIDKDYIVSQISETFLSINVHPIVPSAFFDYSDSPTRNLKDLIKAMYKNLGMETKNIYELLDTPKYTNLQTLPGSTLLNIEKIFKLILPRLCEESVHTEDTTINAVIPDARQFAAESTTLRKFTLREIDPIWRTIQIVAFNSRVKKEDPKTLGIKQGDNEIESLTRTHKSAFRKVINELKVVYMHTIDNSGTKDSLSKEKEDRTLGDLSDDLEAEDYKLLESVLKQTKDPIQDASKLKLKDIPRTIQILTQILSKEN